jgi:hypothetical protein
MAGILAWLILVATLVALVDREDEDDEPTGDHGGYWDGNHPGGGGGGRCEEGGLPSVSRRGG